MTWTQIANVKLTSSGDTLDSGTMDEYKMYVIHAFRLATGNLDNEKLRFNNDSGSNYSYRHATNGASDSTNINDSGINFNGQTAAQNGFINIYVFNFASGEEKLAMNIDCRENAAGAGNCVNEQVSWGKWANTSSNITQIQLDNGGTGDYDTDSFMTIYGANKF
jgi:hypothetical protein